jgi:hypothetical protein
MEYQIQTITQRIKEVQNWQKIYIDAYRVDHSYEVGDQVFLQVKPHKSSINFGKGDKLVQNPYSTLGLRDLPVRISSSGAKMAL